MITYDLNRISHFTQRMFYCAWREARDDRIHVLPQVQAELLKGWDIEALEQSKRSREHELLESNVAWTPGLARYARIQIWWAGQLLDRTSQFHRVRLDAQTRNRKHALMEELPAEAFRGARPEDIQNHGDAHMVAEALATGSPLLLTRNMKSIVRSVLNAWVRDEQARLDLPNVELIQDGDETVVRMLHAEKHTGVRGIVAIVLAACWPRDEQASFETLAREYHDFTDRMEGAGLGECALVADAQWRREPRMRERIELVRANLPVHTRRGYQSHPQKVSGWEDQTPQLCRKRKQEAPL